MINYLFFDIIYFFKGPKTCPVGSGFGFGQIRNSFASGSGSINQDYGSTDSEKKEIFTDMQHCNKYRYGTDLDPNLNAILTDSQHCSQAGDECLSLST
jgi:hypothetical protein